MGVLSWLRRAAPEVWENDLLPADLIVGTKGDDSLTGTDGDDHMRGRRGNDTLLGGLGLDTLRGGSGDDSLDGGLGADRMVGGLGNDVYFVDDVLDRTFERARGGFDTVISTVDWTLAPQIENLILQGAQTSTLHGFGNDKDNEISSAYGRVAIDGGGGNDILTGAYHISPGIGDTLWGGDGDDVIKGGGGYYHSDALYGGAGNDTLNSSGGSLYGEDGDDQLVSAAPHGPKPIADYLDGGAGNDTLLGGSSSFGGDGDDLIETGHGLSAYGGLGNDTIRGEGGGGTGGHWVIDAGAGNDYVDVSYGSAGFNLKGGEGNDFIKVTGISSVVVDAGLGDDTVMASASSGSASIGGGEGNDSLSLIVRSANATISGGWGNDTLTAVNSNALGELVLQGDDGDDWLSAAGASSIQLTGGQGSDSFVLSAREKDFVNRVALADFASGVDRIGVKGLLVGDGDLKLEGRVEVPGPGGFDASAELVIISSSATSTSLADAAAAIGSANQAYVIGQTALFVVHSGSSSSVLYFQSSGNDATVTADELSFLAHLGSTPGQEDFFLTG